MLDTSEDKDHLEKVFRNYDADGSSGLDRQEFGAFAVDIVEYMAAKHPQMDISSLAMESGKKDTKVSYPLPPPLTKPDISGIDFTNRSRTWTRRPRLKWPRAWLITCFRCAHRAFLSLSLFSLLSLHSETNKKRLKTKQPR